VDVPKELYTVFAEVTTFSPISIFTPYTSTSANTYLLPPPTTLVGALAYAYKRSLNDFKELDDNGLSPALEMVEKSLVLYASAGVDEQYTLIKSVERVYQHIYLRSEYWSDIGMAYTVGVRSAVITKKLYIFYIVSNEDVARYSYSIVRIGRKESLVSIDSVVVVPLKEVLSSEKSCDTVFYFPLSIAKIYSPKDSWISVDMPKLTRENFEKKSIVTEKYVVPKPFVFAKATVELNDNGAVVKMNVGSKVFAIPIPREVAE
jgi:CRISPR-associated protein Cas5a/b/c